MRPLSIKKNQIILFYIHHYVNTLSLYGLLFKIPLLKGQHFLDRKNIKPPFLPAEGWDF